MLKNAELVIIDSVWGHVGTFRRSGRFCIPDAHLLLFATAGGGANPTDVAFITKKIQEFLA